MINKNNLKNKHVTYIDKQSAYRTHKVTRVTGNTLTVKDALGKRTRIHPDKFKILGRQKKKEIEEIKW